MTTTDLTTPMRDLHERGQRRMPCDGYELHREHGDAHMHGTVITDDCSGTILDPSPAADLSRAVADGVPAVKGEVCGKYHNMDINGYSDEKPCNKCGERYRDPPGYVGGLPALEGALVACNDWTRVGSLSGKAVCRGCGQPWGENHYTAYEYDYQYRLATEPEHILVLNPDWARDLAAGEFGALVGRIEQRLRRVGARVWWENRNESANVGCIIKYKQGTLDDNLPSLYVRNAGFPSQLAALLDALAKAAGVGSAA